MRKINQLLCAIFILGSAIGTAVADSANPTKPVTLYNATNCDCTVNGKTLSCKNTKSFGVKVSLYNIKVNNKGLLEKSTLFTYLYPEKRIVSGVDTIKGSPVSGETPEYYLYYTGGQGNNFHEVDFDSTSWYDDTTHPSSLVTLYNQYIGLDNQYIGLVPGTVLLTANKKGYFDPEACQYKPLT